VEDRRVVLVVGAEAVRVGGENLVEELQPDPEQRHPHRADHEEGEQDPTPRELDQRVPGNRGRSVHALVSVSLMKEGMLSRFGWLASTSCTKTSSRFLPSGTTSDIVPSISTRPLARMATLSQTRSTSLSRWLLRRI